MIRTQGLTHIHLAVSDLQRSLRFYREVFGMQERFWDGQNMVFLNTPGSDDTIRQAEEEDTIGLGDGVAHFGFRLVDKADLSDAIRTIVEAGGSLVEQGEHQPGTPLAYVADPDGYVIELLQTSEATTAGWPSRPTHHSLLLP